MPASQFTVYILQSEKTNRYYVGQTHQLDERLKRHNHGLVSSTKNGIPWKLVFHEQHHTRAEAMQREKEIKSYKGGILFKKLLGLWEE